MRQGHGPDMADNTRQQLAQTANIEQARSGIGSGTAEQKMVRLMAAQHVIDQVAGKGHLPSRFLVTRKPPLNQT